MRLTCGACLLALATLLGGCLLDPSAPSVAVVDLDAVGRQLGRIDDMNAQLQERRMALSTELQAAAVEVRQRLQVSQQALGDDASAEARQDYQRQLAEASRDLEARKRDAEREVGQLRQSLILDFRQAARPVIEQVAREHGATLVFSASDSLLWHDRSVDITSAVLAAMGGPRPTATGAPVDAGNPAETGGY